jgi:hypothetical protein
VTITPDNVGSFINLGTTVFSGVMQIISAIRASSGLTEAQKQAAIAQILADLPADIAEVKADAAHVRQVDDSNSR